MTGTDPASRFTSMRTDSSMARPAMTALVIGLAIVLALFAFGLGPGVLLILGALVLGPSLWWRWKTREFRRAVRALRANRPDTARAGFQTFIERVARDDGFLRYQPFFNLGRPYDYVAAAHSNLGVLALRIGDRSEAERAFETALTRSPGFAEAHYGQAAARLLGDRPAEAEQAALAGLASQPGHRPCAILAALCRAEQGDREGAKELLSGLRKPLGWDAAVALWAKMYRFWGADGRAARWENAGIE